MVNLIGWRSATAFNAKSDRAAPLEFQASSKSDIISINGSYKVHQRKALETRTVEEHFCPECLKPAHDGPERVQQGVLFDHLISPGEERCGHGDPQRLRRLEVDH